MPPIAPISASALSSARSQICRSCSSRISLVSRRAYASPATTSRSTTFGEIEPALPNQAAEPTPVSALRNPEDGRDLERIGSHAWLWRNGGGNVPNSIQRFAPPTPIADSELKTNLQFALIETILHHHSTAGQNELLNMPVPPNSSFSTYFPDGIRLVQSDSQHRIVFPSKANRTKILKDLALPNSPGSLESISEFKEGDSQAETESTEWLQYPLQDLSLRFNLLSRLYARTGHRLADVHISKCTTPAVILSILTTKPERKIKLLEAINKKDVLPKVENVRIADRQLTKYDKDLSVGRWKLVRHALASRGLPEFGVKKPRQQRAPVKYR